MIWVAIIGGYGKYSGKIEMLHLKEPPKDRIHRESFYVPPNPIPDEDAPAGSNAPGRRMSGSPNGILRDSLGEVFPGPWSYVFPPDPQVAVSEDYVVSTINSHISIYDKTGEILYWNFLDSFFPFYPGYGMVFDPKLVFDVLAKRWYVLALFASWYPDPESSFYYLAVSEGEDPLGGWYFYKLNASMNGSTPTHNWADYPGLGYNDRWIVITSNQFTFEWNWKYGKVRFLNKEKALSGALDGWTDFWGNFLGEYTYTIRPMRPLTPSEDMYLLKVRIGNEYLHLWKFSGEPDEPHLSLQTTLGIRNYPTPSAVPQGGGYHPIEGGSQKGIMAVVYYDGKLYLSFEEGQPNDYTMTGARLVVVDVRDTVPFVLEDLSIYEPHVSWIYPTVGVSPKGVVIVFTRVGPSDYPSVFYVARAVGELEFSESKPITWGSSWYEEVYDGRNRWGDYFGAAMDPADSSVWVIGEYADYTDAWSTTIAKVSLEREWEFVFDPKLDVEAIYDISGRRVRITDMRRGIYFVRTRDGKIRKILKLYPFASP
ncbi:MAG: hypothetical protein GXO29_00045 [Thermotogae bacterium]|nr:hypothetical protein [Thermotogota bacterium]